MPELLFLKEPAKASDVLHGLSADDTQQLCTANQVMPGTSLPRSTVFSLESDSLSVSVRNQLNRLAPAERQCIAGVAEACGDETAVLAAFLDRYFGDENMAKLNAAIGAGATGAFERLNNFEKAVVTYQKSLNNLRSLVESGKYGRGHGQQVIEAKRSVRIAYAELAQRYAIELQSFSPEAHRAKNRGTAFSNAERGITLAKRKPRAPKPDIRLNVEGQLQASQIAKMGKLINGLGTATIVADGVFRTTEVMGIAEEGGDWMRAGAREVTGFGAGTAAGLFAGKAAYFGLISIAGPVGWGVLGAIFMVSLGVGYLASKVGSDFGEAVSDAAWDMSK
ncbi:hypothetical protein [Thalassolituus sp. UBA2590]|uniref:hypothetical protein n=2 Tax=unclassified Thalassolituus TaxID=2624967 RepID=UPI0026479780|nr:hypothetical protein [Thalassolituus sp. UBA2590]